MSEIKVRWMDCELIESVEGRCGGQPVVVATRVFPGPIVNSFEDGESVEEIREDYPSLTTSQVERLIAFAREQRLLAAA